MAAAAVHTGQAQLVDQAVADLAVMLSLTPQEQAERAHRVMLAVLVQRLLVNAVLAVVVQVVLVLARQRKTLVPMVAQPRVVILLEQYSTMRLVVAVVRVREPEVRAVLVRTM